MSTKGWSASVIEVNLAAIRHNFKLVRRCVGRKGILAVVKANAYGHGNIEVARCLTKMGVAMLGVAYLEEGLALREAGIEGPILIMTGVSADQIPEVVQYRLTPVLFDRTLLTALNRYARRYKKRVDIHIKIDTGMGRLGLATEDALDFVQKAADLEGIHVEGILTHFADADLADLSFAERQLGKMKGVWEHLRREGIRIPYCHIANSAAIMHYHASPFNLVRPGLMLYGYSPLQGEATLPLHPAMQLKTRVISIKKVSAGVSISYGRTFVTKRESLIATLSLGYADGYPRLLSNRGVMIAKGRRVPVVGRVCMDMTMIDATEVSDLAAGEWVTVIGSEGKESVWADELARWTDTISYEILCGISDRIPRVYLHAMD